MARIGENAFRQYRDGQDRLTAPEYMAERELIRLAVNDLDDKVQRTEGIREEFSNTINEVETVKGEVVQTKQEVETRIGEFAQTIDQATQEVQQVSAQMVENTDKEINILSYRHLVKNGLWDDAFEQALIDADENGKLVLAKSKKYNYKISRSIKTKFPNQVISGNGIIKVDATPINAEEDALSIEHTGCIVEKIHVVQALISKNPTNKINEPSAFKIKADNVDVRDCRNEFGLHGFVVNANLVTVDNCRSKKTREKGILTKNANEFSLTRNKTTESGWDGNAVSILAGSGIQITGLDEGMKNVNIEGNISTDNAGNGIQMTLLGGETVNHSLSYKNNRTLRNKDHGASLKITNDPSYTSFDRLYNITVEHNVSSDNWAAGMHVDFAKNVTFANNSFYRNGRNAAPSSFKGFGLALIGCKFVTLSNNKFIKNLRGLHLFSTSHVRSFGDQFFNNYEAGVWLGTPSSAGTFKGLIDDFVKDVHLNGCVGGVFPYQEEEDPLDSSELARNTQQRFIMVNKPSDTFDNVTDLVLENCTSLEASITHIAAPNTGCYRLINSTIGNSNRNYEIGTVKRSYIQEGTTGNFQFYAKNPSVSAFTWYTPDSAGADKVRVTLGGGADISDFLLHPGTNINLNGNSLKGGKYQFPSKTGSDFTASELGAIGIGIRIDTSEIQVNVNGAVKKTALT